MRIFNRLIFSLVLGLSLVNICLAFAGQNDLSVYFITNALVYLVITLLYVYLNPRARNVLNGVSVVIFGGFLVIVSLKVIEILK